jgi:hypothetical protein
VATLSEVQALIAQQCDGIKQMLLEKNQKYGNAYFDPVQVFSQLPAEERLKSRIDEKLERIRTIGLSAIDEDTLKDLIGCLLLLKIAVLLEDSLLVERLMQRTVTPTPVPTPGTKTST